MTSVSTEPLSARLRAGTAAAHESAERSPFLQRLLGGELDIAAWQLLLEQLRYVYAALESTADRMPDNDACVELLSVELDRGTAIAHDLASLEARTGLGPVGLLPSTRAYAERIRDCHADPVRYLAHHYTRYLGDLSGGQAMRVWLHRHYDLPDEQAAFFRFDQIASVPRFKQRYRAGLDALGLDAADERRLVDEAAVSFAANEEVFDDLLELVPTASPARVA